MKAIPYLFIIKSFPYKNRPCNLTKGNKTNSFPVVFTFLVSLVPYAPCGVIRLIPPPNNAAVIKFWLKSAYGLEAFPACCTCCTLALK